MVRKEDISVTCVKKLFIAIRSLSDIDIFIQERNLSSAVNVRKHSKHLITKIRMNVHMINLIMCVVLFVIRKYERDIYPNIQQDMKGN